MSGGKNLEGHLPNESIPRGGERGDETRQQIDEQLHS